MSIIRTIATSPGSIPSHREWDMASEAEDDSERDEDTQQLLRGGSGADKASNDFTNLAIEQSMRNPSEQQHQDIKYLVTSAGPLLPTGSQE